MSHNVIFNFEDGVSRSIKCNAGEMVVEAAYRHGVNIPMDCREGACGTCKCRVESGTYTLKEYVEDALSPAEFEQGFALTCQMRIQSDCVVLVPVDSAACNTKPVAYSATIADVVQLSDSTFSLVLEGADLSRLHFLPGQYAKVKVPGTDQTRSYSFSSTIEHQRATFLIRNVPGGLMSGFLKEQARLGMAMSLTGPLGSFYLRDIRRPVLMLAGGTGLAPFLAMLDEIQQRGGSAHPVHLIYGVNTDADVVEFDRLEAFARAMPNFSFDVVVVDATSVFPRKGYVTAHMLPEQLNDGDVDIYLCGPPPMVEAVSRFMAEGNFSSKSFLFEKFAPSAV